MSKLFLTQHLNQVFTHKRKMEKIADEQSAIKENEVFKLRQEAVTKERIAQDQSRQEGIIQEQTTLRVEQERIALEKLTLKADQEALQERQEILTQIKNGIVSAKVSIQQKLQAERDQLDKEKAEYERVINTIILNETNETIVEDDNTVQLIGNDSDFIII